MELRIGRHAERAPSWWIVQWAVKCQMNVIFVLFCEDDLNQIGNLEENDNKWRWVCWIWARHARHVTLWLCHVMSCHDLSCHDVSCHDVSCHDVSCHVVSCHDVSCHDVSCHYAMFHADWPDRRVWTCPWPEKDAEVLRVTALTVPTRRRPRPCPDGTCCSPEVLPQICLMISETVVSH